MELIKVKNGDYDYYEELLLKRDALRKDAGSIMTAYIKEFGDLVKDSYEKKVECIKLKKQLAYCQMQINMGRSIDADAMHSHFEFEMTEYYRKIKEIADDNERARKAKTSSEATLLAVKKLYRKIAKKLHPDINPKTNGDKDLSDLWNRVLIAYRANDIEGMRELEVLTVKAMEQMGENSIVIDIPDIADKISGLEKEIDEIKTTDPYLYKELLDDDSLCQDEKDKFEKDISEYSEYADDLRKTLEDMLTQNGVTIKWQMK